MQVTSSYVRVRLKAWATRLRAQVQKLKVWVEAIKPRVK